jgi:hypothetical protein
MTNGLTPVMELEAHDGASASGTTITVFGTDRKDLTKLGTVRREIHVALLDPRTDAQSLYPATILRTLWLSLRPLRSALPALQLAFQHGREVTLAQRVLEQCQRRPDV